MGKYTLNLSDKAVKDLSKIYKSGDKKVLKQLKRFLKNFNKTHTKGLENRKP